MFATKAARKRQTCRALNHPTSRYVDCRFNLLVDSERLELSTNGLKVLNTKRVGVGTVRVRRCVVPSSASCGAAQIEGKTVTYPAE